MSTSHCICKAILTALSDVLALEGPARFENCHREKAPSNCTLELNKYPKRSTTDGNLGHNAHTDLGSITLLFASEWGLQLLSPKTGKWAYVAPLAGYATVNVADSLRFLSGNRLRSCLHRVVPYPGCEERARYSFGYFLRPDRDTLLQDLDGNEWTAQEWQERKFISYGETHSKQRMSSLQTGQKGVLGLWNQ
jgi:isopenicillin N synthase-like dioxygenase